MHTKNTDQETSQIKSLGKLIYRWSYNIKMDPNLSLLASWAQCQTTTLCLCQEYQEIFSEFTAFSSLLVLKMKFCFITITLLTKLTQFYFSHRCSIYGKFIKSLHPNKRSQKIFQSILKLYAFPVIVKLSSQPSGQRMKSTSTYWKHCTRSYNILDEKFI